VREVRPSGNTRLAPDIMVLSLPPALAGRAPNLAVGGQLKLSTATTPLLRGVISAISGGPVLVQNGDAQRIEIPRNSGGIPYQFRSMVERHPRAAIGWNDRHFFLIQVDGRQRDLSMGMTLEELGKFAFKQLRVTDAMNLDGGVSATLWANGRVRNSPADHGQEKDLANSVAIVRQKATR
jgi:exopolysaccharide biosynthesis protein